MTRSNGFGTVAGLLIHVALLSGISGCDNDGEIRKRIENLDQVRATALAQSEFVPYRTDQYQALKVYFSELNRIVLALKIDPKLAGRFSAAVSKTDLKVTCPKVFVAMSQWQVIMERCTRNRFFLCSEEVRAYPEMLSVLRRSLTPELQRKFDQTETCPKATMPGQP